MIQSDGKTQEVGRRRKDSERENESTGLVKYGSDSSVNGINQVGNVASYCPGQDPVRSSIEYGEGSFGKILERLDFIENAYFSYVEAHQQRLEARLVESKEQKELFKQTVQELRQEVYDLASSEAE